MGAFRALYGHAAGRPDIVRGSYAAGHNGQRIRQHGRQAAGVNGRQALGVTAGGRLCGAARQAAGRRPYAKQAKRAGFVLLSAGKTAQKPIPGA